MKSYNLGEVNGWLPAKTTQYQTGWVTRSFFEGGCVVSEADLFKLLGEAIEHHEQMTKAIQNLRSLVAK